MGPGVCLDGLENRKFSSFGGILIVDRLSLSLVIILFRLPTRLTSNWFFGFLPATYVLFPRSFLLLVYFRHF